MKTILPRIFVILLLACLTISTTSCKNNNNNNNNNTSESFLIVANSMDDTVTIIRDSDKSIVATVALSGDFPWEIALSSDQTLAFVIQRDSNSVSIVDVLAGTETGSIALTNTQPSKALLASDGFLYVTHANAAVVTKVDVMAMTPAEVGTIAITATSGNCIAESNDGSSLYVGSSNDANLCKIDLASGMETSASPNIFIADLKIAPNGMAYVIEPAGQEVHLYDTLTDMWAPNTIEMTTVDLEMTGLVIEGGKVFVAANCPGDTGGVAEFALNFDQTNFQYDSADDDSYDVMLPFTYNFLGTGYNMVTMNSNGVVGIDGIYYDYDEGVENIVGFTPNNEDLDSSDFFNYSSMVHPDRVVFNWHTSCNDDEPNANFFFTAEVVIYDNGMARFSYLNSGPDGEPDEDDGYLYGVGDGTMALVDLRQVYGSPFSITRTTLWWDPAVPNMMVPGNFEWEGTGLHFSPAIRVPEAAFVSGVAVTPSSIYMAATEDYNDNDLNEILVYDRATMLPVSSVVVGGRPSAIVRAQP